MNGNGLNLLSYEKFDEALNIINSLDACDPGAISSSLQKAGNLPGGYSGISSSINDIASQLKSVGNGSLPDLVQNYKSSYSELKSAIIDAFVAEYEFLVESGNINGSSVQISNLGFNDNKSGFLTLLGSMKGDSSNKFSSLEEFFKALDDACKTYSISFGEDEYVSNLQPKNNNDIAHRGLRKGDIKENSLEAFELAGLSGFWGVETDIRFDSNGNLVCSHNAVKNGENPPTLEEYLDICKKYGMTAILDLKYIDGPQNAEGGELSKAILDVVSKKGMLDSCVFQTNSAKDIKFIRENSNDARIWCLTDEVNKNMDTIINNGVECVNITGKDGASAVAKRLVDAGIGVCVWNVQNENYKSNLEKLGVSHIMTDNNLGIAPYQEGELDVNKLNYTSNKNSNVDYTNLLNIFDTNKLNNDVTTLESLNVTNTGYNPSNGVTVETALYARKGFTYGPQAYETWYDLDMNLVVKNLTNLYGFTDVTSKIREDGVKVVSGIDPNGNEFHDLVMVAADVVASSNPNGTFERGEIVQTSMGTGIVVDMCGEAVNKRKNGGDVHFDIATAWWSGPYSSQIYGENSVLKGYTGSTVTSLNSTTYDVDYSSTNKKPGTGTLKNQVVNLNAQTSNNTPTTSNDKIENSNNNNNNNSGNSNNNNVGDNSNSGNIGNGNNNSSNNIPSYEPPKSNISNKNVVLLSNLTSDDLTNSVIYNKLLCDLPDVHNGVIESANLDNGVVSYNIGNVINESYVDFVDKISNMGYKLIGNDVYSNGNYQLKVSHDNENMKIRMHNV